MFAISRPRLAAGVFAATAAAAVLGAGLASADTTSNAIVNAQVGSCLNVQFGATQSDGNSSVTVEPASCGSSAANYQVVSRTTNSAACGDQAWVENQDHNVVLCLDPTS
ncbi:hypothetical protein FOS14_14245 [Skermania sp. ID1734]|uniref:LppU/SCO3897 family protein n=1 Tax=Skermania sp. ID1734 TaxID=2597516 RepID=UPI00117F0356|nr:hypothetical protein [Skermania sp. ID1734]TSD98142.1 hypothetical protein FOS14_14245 [Skermania sp. ID1734]